MWSITDTYDLGRTGRVMQSGSIGNYSIIIIRHAAGFYTTAMLPYHTILLLMLLILHCILLKVWKLVLMLVNGSFYVLFYEMYVTVIVFALIECIWNLKALSSMYLHSKQINDFYFYLKWNDLGKYLIGVSIRMF